jgi:hypothetical protein
MEISQLRESLVRESAIALARVDTVLNVKGKQAKAQFPPLKPIH